jgi:diadenosine tetraphosphate (Ap4A) HIT family hydrolase/glutathione S-transferase
MMWMQSVVVIGLAVVTIVCLQAQLASCLATMPSSVMGATTTATTSSKYTLYDTPVSNNGARCRVIIYKKNISPSEIDIQSPAAMGGLKSPEYLSQVNPQGKMPGLMCHETGFKLSESDTICRYLLTTYKDGPSFQPDNPLSNLMCRYHDLYIGPIQNCMYKEGPFGRFGTRKDALDEVVRQIHILEDLFVSPSDGPYACGNEISLADATLFPTMLFAQHMLPKFDRMPTTLPPKIHQWLTTLQTTDDAMARVSTEILDGLQGWEDRKRWDPLLGAGWRDTDPPTIFDSIVAGTVTSNIVWEDDTVLAFTDIRPAAPAHVVVIPKNRQGLTRLTKATSEHTEVLGRLLVAAAEIARRNDLAFGDGARIVINDGPDGGQEVPHLHVHVLGGRSMVWPPG